MAYDCLTLLTDYGRAGGFVGVLHAVAFRIAPQIPVIDLDHEIPPQDVRLGGLRLERMMPYVPAGVHVAVVDPGVGGARRGVALTAGGRAFIGPDNGLLVWAARRCGEIEQVVSLDVDRYWLSPRSRTFDGRDVFVPVAAHLAAGVELPDVGSPVSPESLVELERPRYRRLEDGSVELEAVQVDSFGNVQLSGDSALVGELGLQPGRAVVLEGGAGEVRVVFGETFSDVGRGEALVLIDSDGCLAISVNGGDAAQFMGGVRPGDQLRLVASSHI